MKIINVKDVEAKEVDGGNPLFFGGKVHTQFVLEEEYGAKKIQIVNVQFAPGARNKFHTHSVGQILYVTEGKGIVATKEKEYAVTPGFVIFISPGEEHWHGAQKGFTFSHITVTNQNSKTTQYQP